MIVKNQHNLMSFFYRFLFISVLFFSIGVKAQLRDIAKLDYTIIPAGNSPIEFTRVRGMFNYPLKLIKEDTFILLGLDYSNIMLTMDNTSSFDKSKLEDFQLLDLNIGYTTLLKNNWRLGVRITPGFSSNLGRKKLNFEDLTIASDVVFIKKSNKKLIGNTKPWRLILGVSYSENRGISYPLPFINYYKKFKSKWAYSIGVPKTDLKYFISEKNQVKLSFELDGFTSNLQQGLNLNTGEFTESINMSLILGSLKYEYHLTKHLIFYAGSSYIFSNSINLRDEERNNILKLDNSNSFYLRTGLKFKI